MDRQLRVTPDNQILRYFHCAKCLQEIPEGESPRTWSRLEVGWTQYGLQVWCGRHGLNVINIDFEGKQLPATDRARKGE